MKSKYLMAILFWVPFWLNAQQTSKISLMPNTRYTKTSDVQATTTMRLYGSEYIYAVNANMETDYDVVSQSSNGYKVKITLESINSQLSSNGVKMSFNSKKDSLTDSDSVFAKPLSDILGETDNVLVDSTGDILSSDTSATHQKANEYVTSTLLLGNDYSVGKKLDIVFHFKDSVRVGLTWSDSTHSFDGLRMDTFKIEKIANNVVFVSVKGQISRTLPVQQGGVETLAHFEGTSESTLQVSAISGVIKNRVMKTHIQSQINVNNVEIPISSDIQLNEVVQ